MIALLLSLLFQLPLGGSSPVVPPLPLGGSSSSDSSSSSARSQYHFAFMTSPRLVQQTMPCGGLIGEVRRWRVRTFQNKQSADSLVVFLRANWDYMKRVCAERYELWFYQPLTGALSEAERFGEIILLVETDSLQMRYRLHWVRYGGLIMDRYARSLMKGLRHQEADSAFVEAEHLYQMKNDRESVPQYLAEMKVNRAYNAFYMGRYRLARRLLNEALPTLERNCCANEEIVFFLTEAERLRGLMAGKGLEGRSDGDPQSRGGSWLLAAFLIFAAIASGAWCYRAFRTLRRKQTKT